MKKCKVLVIKSLFCPDLCNLTISINSLVNISELISLIHGFDMSFALMGWCKKEEFRTKVTEVVAKLVKDIKIVEFDMWDYNYGKFRIINRIIDLCKDTDYDYILYSDHDIIFPPCEKIKLFTKMKNYLKANIIVNNKQIGLIAFNHKDDIRHQYDIYTSSHSKYTSLIYPCSSSDQNFTSIATGAYFAKAKLFSLMNKFKPISVYGFDDYYLLRELDKMNYSATVHKGLFVLHPFHLEQNVNYIKWKKSRVLLIMRYINEEKYDELEKLYAVDVVESEKVWDLGAEIK